LLFPERKNEDAAEVGKGVGKSFDHKMQNEIRSLNLKENSNTFEFKVVQQDLGRWLAIKNVHAIPCTKFSDVSQIMVWVSK